MLVVPTVRIVAYFGVYSVGPPSMEAGIHIWGSTKRAIGTRGIRILWDLGRGALGECVIGPQNNREG